MSATTSSDEAARLAERRRNPRLRASSLIYAQLGSDNGGIVVNLGLDGMACHAAHHLIADKNSALSLTLRGSGLNAEISGEIVWLNGTKKEVGISFKSLSANVQQNLADWIDRESQPIEIAGLEKVPQQKTISAIADLADSEKKTIPRSLSAALALSRAMAKDPSSPSSHALEEPKPDLLLGSSAEILPLTPKLETFPAVEYSRSGADHSVQEQSISEQPTQKRLVQEELVKEQVGDQGQARESNPNISVELPEKNDLLDNQQASALTPVIHVEQSPAKAMEEPAPLNKSLEIRQEIAPEAPAQIDHIEEIGENKTAKAIPATPIAQSLRRSPGETFAERWIPPALLSLWNGWNAPQRKLIGHVAAVCLGGMIGLLLVLVVTHIHGISRPSSESTSQPQATIAPASPNETTGNIHDAQHQAATAASTISSARQPEPNHPSTSLLSKIADSILGNKPDENSKISDYQMGLEVWTSQSSGYYYCSDDPYAKQVQDGSPMLQGDALQAGYRARLGQFCN